VVVAVTCKSDFSALFVVLGVSIKAVVRCF